jgi:hypothetical protein
MMRSVQDWRINLIKGYPDLFHTPGGRPVAAPRYPAREKGWRDLRRVSTRKCARWSTFRRRHSTRHR